MHLEARHENFIVWSEVSKQHVARVIFISCLSRKSRLKEQQKGRARVFWHRVRYDGEVSACGRATLHSDSLGHGIPQEVLTPQPPGHFTLITIVLTAVCQLFRLGVGGERWQHDLLLHPSPCSQLFSTSVATFSVGLSFLTD